MIYVTVYMSNVYLILIHNTMICIDNFYLEYKLNKTGDLKRRQTYFTTIKWSKCLMYVSSMVFLCTIILFWNLLNSIDIFNLCTVLCVNWNSLFCIAEFFNLVECTELTKTGKQPYKISPKSISLYVAKHFE